MTGDDFREIVLDMQGAGEGAHMGHPDFRANGRIFATLDAPEEWGVVMVAPEEQRELMRAHPKVFVPAAGKWGEQGCTKVKLDVATRPVVRGAVVLAWERVIAKPAKPAKPPKRAASKSTTARRPRR